MNTVVIIKANTVSPNTTGIFRRKKRSQRINSIRPDTTIRSSIDSTITLYTRNLRTELMNLSDLLKNLQGKTIV